MQNFKRDNVKISKIALLGIDGSGKSAMSEVIKKYLSDKGYDVKVIPFHKWLFAGKLRDIFSRFIDHDRKERTSPYSPPIKSFSARIKPPIAFIDNLLFYLINSPRNRKQVYIYDRFVCATQIKFSALNYSNKWFRKIWWSVKPDFAIIFDVDINESIKRQLERKDSYAYTYDQLSFERDLYIKYAKTNKFPIVTSIDKQSTQEEVLNYIKEQFDFK